MVDAKCMNGHTFDVEKDMVSVTKSGTSFKATCPQCGAPAQLTHKKVIEIMGLKDNNEARALKEKMAAALRGDNPQNNDAAATGNKPNVKGTMRPIVDIGTDDQEYDDQFESTEGSTDIYSEPESGLAEALEKGGNMTPMMQELAAAERQLRAAQGHPSPQQNRVPVQAPAARPTRKRPPIDVMGTAATVRDRNDVLRDTIEATNLPDNVKQKIYRFISLRPDGIAPHELYSVLTYLGIGNSPAMAVVRAYEFDLSIQQQEVEQERQLFNLLGIPIPDVAKNAPGNYPGTGLPFDPQAGSRGGGATNPFLTPTQRPFPGVGGASANGTSSGGKNEPQIDVMSLMPILAQYPQAFQLLAANPALMQAVAQNPAMLFQVIQMSGAQRANEQQPSQPAGMSREEVRAIISAEMGEIKKMLSEVAGGKKEDAMMEAMRQNQQFLLDFLKMSAAKNESSGNTPDPLAQQQSQIVSMLLNNLLERQNQDNTGAVLQAIEELKKNQTGLGLGSQSIEGMNLFLRYQELANQMEETRRRFQDEREKRESLKEIVNTAAQTIGDTLAGVIQQGIGRAGGIGGQAPPGLPPARAPSSGRMRPSTAAAFVEDVDDEPPVPDRTSIPGTPQDGPETPEVADPPGVRSLNCLKCGTPIYVPIDAQKAECPSCHEVYRVTRGPANSTTPSATPSVPQTPVEESAPAAAPKGRRGKSTKGSSSASRPPGKPPAPTPAAVES